MIAMIDIGGTNIKYGVIDWETENYQFLGEQPTKINQKKFRMEDRLEKIISPLLKIYDIQGIAISTAGVVDIELGKIVHANRNIPNYKGTSLKEILENKYNIPVTIENDVNAALLGELNFGIFKNIHSALMITIGTGVGGALYLNEEIHHGFTYCGGEIGYSIMNGKDIEEIASTDALIKKVAKETGNEKIDGRWVFEQAITHENPIAVHAIDCLITQIIYLINNSVALINPEYVILGGGIMEQVNYLKPLVLDKFKEVNKNDLVVQNTKIEFASLGNQAGMLGAYVHFKKKLKRI
ncbi:MAG: ROK family protein [Atopostipes sp.]|nr:ROK family protein [Atopostipes sp.]